MVASPLGVGISGSTLRVDNEADDGAADTEDDGEVDTFSDSNPSSDA